MNCRHCHRALHAHEDLFIDLGSAPPSNAFLGAEALNRPETYLPLKVLACPDCGLVQVDELQRHDELFSADYVYFSSFSASWLAHARDYVAQVVERLGLNSRSQVMEVASNDGYLLQYLQQRDIPCVGIEPTESTARVARSRGIETIGEFFGLDFAYRFVAQRGRCDLVLGNNVLAHVPDINDFVAGLAAVLAPQGTLTLEFPHLLQLVQQAQFDTVYHEHFSYLSLQTVQRILRSRGLEIFDVQELPTHGGSLRVWARHAAHVRPVLPAVEALLQRERQAGVGHRSFHAGLQKRAERIKDDLLRFLIDCKRDGRRVAAYGAAAKGNTLLNFAGVRPDLLPFVVDASPHKQGLFLPGSHIPVRAPQHLLDGRPDVVLILPWNLREEVVAQLQAVRGWGGRFATAVPELRVD